MEAGEIASSMAKGSATYVDRDVAMGEIPWHPHSKFKGVFLKHVVTGADTEGRVSCHLVRIDPNAVLEDHAHDGQWEIHEVIEGEGRFMLGSKETPYRPGRIAVIPKGVRHKVIAGGDGLFLLAKFFPALL